MMSSDTTTLWEVDKKETIDAFHDYLAHSWDGYLEGAAEDMFAEIQGRERTFRQEHGCMIGAQQVCLFDHECETVLVEVTDD